ncbi:MAG: hypothetical protein H0V51_23865 [Chloroflexi bacterium]|nr:hypothetical protein [Chloroflexota bacterium]
MIDAKRASVGADPRSRPSSHLEAGRPQAAAPPDHPVPPIADRASAIAPYLVLALCSLVLFRDGLFGGTVFYERDTFLFYAPLGRWYAEQLQGGSLPLWMPLIFGGYPLFADGEIGMLYPLNLLLLPLLPSDGWLTPMRALHLFLAGAFMHAFLRTLGAGRWGALVGGLVFAFGSFFITQIQHENLVRSAVWLPLILLCVERALRTDGWARQRYLVLGGLALAVAALGLHVQPIAMTLLALGLYTTYRVVVGPIAGRPWERVLLLVWAPGLVTAVGLGGAAVQLLPLFELGRTSYRGPGLIYDLATAWPLRWQNLPTVVFPYLFRLDDGRYITLWQQWETFLYVGMAPLGLGLLAVLFARRRIVPFFVLIGLFGLLVGLVEQSPLNVYRLLWGLPGFSSLRAPGRFAYLIVFAAAGLAAFGMDWLASRRRRSSLGAAAGLSILAGAGGLAWLVVAFRTRLLADPVRWNRLIDEEYVGTRHEYAWLEGSMVYEHLVAALDLADPKIALSVGLLAACGLLVMAWALWPRQGAAWATALVTLVAGDLLVFGYDFHPRAPLAELVRPAPVTSFLAEVAGHDTVGADFQPAPIGDAALWTSGRALADSALPALEPNRLMYADVPSLGGYSSLQSQRHFEYWSNADRQKDVLLDLGSVRHVIVADPPTDVALLAGTAYRPHHPIFNGAAANQTGQARFAIEPFRTVEVRVLGTLADGVHLEDGVAVAEVHLVGRDGARHTLTLRAGLDLAENSYERPYIRSVVRHFQPPVAATVPDIDQTGATVQVNLYRSSFAVDPLDVEQVEIRHVQPRGQTRIFGLGLVDPTGTVRSIFAADREKFRPVFRDGGLVVLENGAAFPRAYVVSEAIARRSRTEESALPRLALRPFDAARQVILEDGPFDGLRVVEQLSAWEVGLGGREHLSPGSAPPGPHPRVDDLATDHVRIDVPDGPGGYLVLADTYHRGWKARVDGAEAPVYLANFLFRAIGLPPGPHTVDFVFDPLSLRLGRAISLATLAFALLVALVPSAWSWGGRSRR